MCMKAATYAKHFSAGLIVIPSHPSHLLANNQMISHCREELDQFSLGPSGWAESISGIGLSD